MKTRQLQAVRTLAIAFAVWAVVTGIGGLTRTTTLASCTRVEHFRSALCNDMRHFAGEWNQNVMRDQQRAPEIHCDDAWNFRSARCNDMRHFGPVPR